MSRGRPQVPGALIRPVIVLAAKILGPGSLRLEMVKIAHRLDERVVRLRETFPLHVNDFDRRLESDLARMLDRVVHAPAPPRWGRRGPGAPLRLYSGSGGVIAHVATVVVLVDPPVEATS